MDIKKIFIKALPFIAYFNICFFWGTSTIANKLSSGEMAPLLVGTLRFITGSLIALGILKMKGYSVKISSHDRRVLFISSFLMYFMNTSLILFAAVRLDASISTIMLCLVPITVILVDSLVGRKITVNKIGLFGIFGGFGGVAIVAVGGMSTGNIDPVGIMLLMAAVFVWAIGTIYLKNSWMDCQLPVQIFYQSLIPAILFTIVAFLMNDLKLSTITWAGYMPAAYMGITDSIIGLMSYMFLLKVWPISRVSTYAYVNPVVGLVLSYFVLGEELTIQKIVGMIVILLSVLIIQKETNIMKYFKGEKEKKLALEK